MNAYYTNAYYTTNSHSGLLPLGTQMICNYTIDDMVLDFISSLNTGTTLLQSLLTSKLRTDEFCFFAINQILKAILLNDLNEVIFEYIYDCPSANYQFATLHQMIGGLIEYQWNRFNQMGSGGHVI